MKTIAALFVETNGAYFGLPGVIPWDELADARRYPGTYPVVAHPPCARWGNYWFGSPSSPKRFTMGDDGGCFQSALESVRRFGGVLEHPRNTRAFARFGIERPPTDSWGYAGDGIGFVTEVEQGHYGHAARKATWLYAAHCNLFPLRWGPSQPGKTRTASGYHSAGRSKTTGRRSGGMLETLSKRERAATPPEFRDMLLALARTVGR